MKSTVAFDQVTLNMKKGTATVRVRVEGVEHLLLTGRGVQDSFAATHGGRSAIELSLIAQIVLRWNALLCLDGELALAEPKRVRQRLLHVAGWIVRSARRTTLRLPRSWPWADALVAVFARLRALTAGAAP